MNTSFMQELNARHAYPEGHMGNRIAEFERRYNNLFEGHLRLQFIVPSDHVGPDGEVDVQSLEAPALALLAVDGADAPENHRIKKIAQKIAARIEEKTGGAAFDADHLAPDAIDDHNLRGLIYPGTKSFRSGTLISSYSGDYSYDGHTYNAPLDDPAMHLDRVVYHEMGHRVLRFLDHKKHPLSDQCHLPMEMAELADEDFATYADFRDENFADGFMALMMVRDHGDKGKKYAEAIGHMRGLGFENGIHKYYTTKTIEAALELANDLGDEQLQATSVEELAKQLYDRQHEKIWSPLEFVEKRDQQVEFCDKVMADTIESDEMPKYRWLLQLRAEHEDALVDMAQYPKANAQNTAARETLLDTFFDESCRELDFVWETEEQKRAAIYQDKLRLRELSQKRTTEFDEDELAKITLSMDEHLEINSELAEEFAAPSPSKNAPEKERC